MKRSSIIIVAVLIITILLSGCEPSKNAVGKSNSHLTVYLWDNNMIQNVVPYIKKQIPNQEIEFIVGNNTIDLYHYMEEHGDLPDIITSRRFSEKDTQSLKPYLLDFGAYNVVSEYYPYALQYYTDTDGNIKWLPVCGIPETIIVNKTLFDQYGIKVPKNYREFKKCCKQLKKNGIKPYASELSMDWAAHSLVQGSAIDQFSSLAGIEWRNHIDGTEKDLFDENLWKKIFAEVKTFMKDTDLTQEDLNCDLSEAYDLFENRKAGMFRGTPSVMESLETVMDDQLVRIPYFAQSSDESWIYTYPSFNIALNKDLEENEEKLNLAMKVLDCFLSKKGQQLVADGSGWISYNVNVKSDLDGMKGVQKEINKNAFYIRYASNSSFCASLLSVEGLLSGKMNVSQACDAFKKEMNREQKQEKSVIKFDKQYDISLNKKGGRDSASAILTTIRNQLGADLAFTSYYYYASSIYKGNCTKSQLNLMLSHNDESYLYLTNITGTQIKELVDEYLKESEDAFSVTNIYELPIASGMKLIVQSKEDSFELKDIEIEGKSIQNEKRYYTLLTDEMLRLLKKRYPDQNFSKVEDTSLSDKWASIIEKGQQPSQPEDYIEVKK